MSLRKSIFSPRACSGLMYSGVPTTSPVARRAQGGPFPDLLRDAEVHQAHDAARVAHEVGGLQVPVDDAGLVDGLQPLGDVDAGVEGLLGGKRTLLASGSCAGPRPR